MLKYSKETLKKLEKLFKAFAYKIRYEKGQFQSGYCLVKQQNVIVINKFFTLEVRINTLLEILQTIELDHEQLELEEELALFWEIVQKEIKPVETAQVESISK